MILIQIVKWDMDVIIDETNVAAYINKKIYIYLTV